MGYKTSENTQITRTGRFSGEQRTIPGVIRLLYPDYHPYIPERIVFSAVDGSDKLNIIFTPRAVCSVIPSSINGKMEMPKNQAGEQNPGYAQTDAKNAQAAGGQDGLCHVRARHQRLVRRPHDGPGHLRGAASLCDRDAPVRTTGRVCLAGTRSVNRGHAHGLSRRNFCEHESFAVSRQSNIFQ